MNRYDFILRGIATRKISVEAENADEALDFMSCMIRRTSVAEFTADEINEMDVFIENTYDENGEIIDDEEFDDDDDFLSDGICFCPYCMNEED